MDKLEVKEKAKGLTIEEFNNLVDNVLTDISNNKVIEAFLYAFKTKAINGCENPYITLNYNFYETRMKAKVVIETVKNILTYLCEKKFDPQKNIVFTEYHINNPKNVVDFIKLNKYDFKDENIANGSKIGLNPDSYKIEYFLNSIKTNYCIAKSEKDYRGLKYTALKLATKDNNIIIINRSAPIYRSRSLLYMIDFPDNEDEFDKIRFCPVENTLFKIPFFPHVLIINNYCFFIVDNIESLFGFEEFNKKQAQSFLDELPKKIKLDEKELNEIKSFVSKGKNFNYFANFDKSRINALNKKDKKIINILKNELFIPFNENDTPIINNQDQAECFISFLCGTIKQDIYSDEKVIAVSCKPLNIKNDN